MLRDSEAETIWAEIKQVADNTLLSQ